MRYLFALFLSAAPLLPQCQSLCVSARYDVHNESVAVRMDPAPAAQRNNVAVYLLRVTGTSGRRTFTQVGTETRYVLGRPSVVWFKLPFKRSARCEEFRIIVENRWEGPADSEIYQVVVDMFPDRPRY